MASIVWSRNSLALPQTFRWNSLHVPRAERVRSLAKRFASAFVTAVVAVVALTFVAMSFGLRVPFLEHSPKNANALAVRPPVKPKIVAAPTKDTCSAAQSQTNTLFASCPTFAVDYSAQQKGLINTNQFNVYSGAPVANKEVEYYTNNPGNIRIENGALVLQAQNQSDQGYKYTSARIDTQGKEDFLYGKLVIRATMPTGIGTWPAIWMLPSQPKYASLSPASDKSRYLNDGEIDIAESIGLQPNVVYGVAHSVAYPEDGPDHAYYNTITVPGNDTTFHDYEIDWTPTTLTFSIDGAPYLTYTKQAGADWHSWPFDQPFYLIINLALGGTWAGKDTAQFPNGGVDQNALPASLKVQDINYYSYVGAQ